MAKVLMAMSNVIPPDVDMNNQLAELGDQWEVVSTAISTVLLGRDPQKPEVFYTIAVTVSERNKIAGMDTDMVKDSLNYAVGQLLGHEPPTQALDDGAISVLSTLRDSL